MPAAEDRDGNVGSAIRAEPGDPGPVQTSTTLARALRWVVALAAVVLVWTIATNRGEGPRVLELAGHAEPAWLILAVLLQIVTYAASAAVLHRPLRACHVRLGLAPLARLGLAKLFTDQALPSAGVGGTLILAQGLARRGVPREAAVGAIVLDLVAFYAAQALACAIALGVLYAHGELDAPILALAAVFALLALAIPGSVLALAVRGVSRAPRVLLRLEATRGLIELLGSAPQRLLRDGRVIASTTALQLLVVVLDAASLWAVLHAIGAPESPMVPFAAHVIATTIGIVSVLPGGIGVFEASAIGVLVITDIPLETALAATLIDRAISFWLPMIPGLLVARAETRERRDALP